MNNLVSISNGQPVTNSLLVAEKFGKRHSDVMRAIEDLLAQASDRGVRNFAHTPYTNSQNGQTYNMYVMTRDGFSLLVMGFTGEKAMQFKLDFIEAFNKMERHIMYGGFEIPQSLSGALRLAAEQAEKIDEQNRLLEAKNERIEAMRPKEVFADSFEVSDTLILMRDMAKLLNQNGIDIGEIRLYEWMVENEYLIRTQRWSRTKQRYEYDYMPTQRAADLKIFFVIERPIPTSPAEPPMIKHTVKVTGKGQIYFMNKFLKAA